MPCKTITYDFYPGEDDILFHLANLLSIGRILKGSIIKYKDEKNHPEACLKSIIKDKDKKKYYLVFVQGDSEIVQEFDTDEKDSTDSIKYEIWYEDIKNRHIVPIIGTHTITIFLKDFKFMLGLPDMFSTLFH